MKTCQHHRYIGKEMIKLSDRISPPLRFLKHILQLYLLIVSVVVRAAAVSPLDGHRICHYTVSDGLASNAVLSIHQDSKGRMWFGTNDGLHSFDGYVMREWRDEQMKTLGAGIYCIAEDESSRLWVGSTRGLALFDLRRERFVELPVDPSSGIRIKSPVVKMSHGADGRVWLATVGEGIFSYDKATCKLTQYPAPARFPDDAVRDVLEDSSGKVWGASQSGVCRYNPKQERFVCVTTSDGKTVYASSLFEDRSHNIWMGTKNEGLYKFDEKSDKFVPVLKSVENNRLFFVRGIVECEAGCLSLVSDTGLICYDIDSGKAVLVRADENSDNALTDNYLHSIFIDREGGLWIGSYFGGVNYVTPRKFSFTHYNCRNTNLTAKVISVFADAEDGNLWIGSDDNGVFHWNRQTGVFTSICNHPLMREAPHKNIHALLQDGNRLMIGMYIGGLNILDLKTGNVRNYVLDDTPESLYSSSIYSLYKDIEGVIWVGTAQGLNIYRPQSDDFERVFEVHPADVCFITDDRQGFLWACTTNAGIYRMARMTGKWEQFYDNESGQSGGAGGALPTNSIVTAECDSNGNIWFGTDGCGLLRFDYDSQTFIRETLPKEIRVINKIISNGDDLWIASPKGLYCYNPVLKEMRSYDKNSGLQENIFLPNSGLKRADGAILMGSIDGFSEFYPDRITHEHHNPDVILADFQIFNKPVEIGSDGAYLKESITYADNLVLPYDQNMISFRVLPLSFINSEQNNYLYMLEGFDKDWYEANPAYTHSYANIPSGRYTFRVRTSDGNGGWNAESLSFPIKVLRPWWFSTCTIILYILAFAAIIWKIYCYSINRQRENFKKLADEKDRELYRSQIEMFTHIVHDIRTPLTLILSPLENILHSKMSVAECRNHLMIMEQNGQRLLNMVNHLMDFRRLELGGIKLQVAPVDLRDPLRRMCDDIILPASVKNIDVVVDLPDSPCVSMIDRSAFRHVVYNLLSNALKFTTSEIRVCLKSEPDLRLRLSVKDNGPGIMPQEREKIFMPFYQIAGNCQTDNIGTGLGLFLVKRFSALMDAEISLDSAVGKGSEFIVWFKATDAEPVEIVEKDESAFELKDGEDYDEHEAPLPEAGNTESREEKKYIVVVDDNDDMLNFLKVLLSIRYDVRAFARAKDALDSIFDHAPDLVISDVMMPEMDGLEFCRILKTDLRTSHVPVILLTAKMESTDIIDGFDNGADMYIIKPFSPQVIEARIRSILTNRALLRDKFRENPSVIETMVSDESPDKRFFTRIKAIVEERLADQEFTVDVLASEVGISRTGLFTKLKSVAKITPNEYIRKIRLEKAIQMLKADDVRVSEVCWNVGFSSRSHFTKCFQAQYGVSPSEYHAQQKRDKSKPNSQSNA